MTTLMRFRTYGLLCVFALIACILLSHPTAEIGINDEWAYVRSAKILADTGHIGYVGWASAMLGWMLPLAAVFIKIFGFSFTAVRASNALTAVVNAFITQRTLVRSGLNDWNSMLVTLTLTLSPLYLPLATTFMTDAAGMTLLTFCFYCCLRALESEKETSALGWVLLALLSSTLGGTARQTIWLGAMLMFPSTLFLLRMPRLWKQLCLLPWLGSLGFIYASLRWFDRQPYSLREAVVGNYVDRDAIFDFGKHIVLAVLGLSLYLLPITIAFLPIVMKGKKNARLWLAGLAVVSVVCLLYGHFAPNTTEWLVPFSGNTFTQNGLMDVREIGQERVMLGTEVRAVLTIFVLLCGAAAVAFCAEARTRDVLVTPTPTAAPGWRALAIITGPYLLAYTVLVLHRGLFSGIFDRYLLIPLFFVALVLVRLYQNKVTPQLPSFCLLAIGLVALFAIAANHDLFARERAVVQAAQELNDAGIPRDRFYGGWEFDGWTQVDHYGWINSGYMMTPHGFSANPPIATHPELAPCGYHRSRLYPAIHPEYALSFDNVACDGPSPFPAVTWHSWLPPYNAKVYIRSAHMRTP